MNNKNTFCLKQIITTLVSSDDIVSYCLINPNASHSGFWILVLAGMSVLITIETVFTFKYLIK